MKVKFYFLDTKCDYTFSHVVMLKLNVYLEKWILYQRFEGGKYKFRFFDYSTTLLLEVVNDVAFRR